MMVDSGGPLPDLGWLPERASRVLLIAAPGEAAGSARAALETAELVARHRPRTLLVSAAAGAAGPEADLGLGGHAGLSEVVSGACRVKDVAVHPPGRSFLVIPSGGVPTAAVELARSPAFRHLLDAAGRGGTLLLLIEADEVASLIDVLSAHEGPDIDGLVLLGSVAVPSEVPATVPVLARVEMTTPAQGLPRQPASESGAGTGFSRPTRTPAIVPGGRRGRPRDAGPAAWVARLKDRGVRRSAAGVMAIWLVAIAAVWLVWQGISGWPAFQEDLDDRGPATAVRDPAFTSPVEDTAQATDTPPGEALPPPDSVGGERQPAVGAERGIELPYSVLVASSVAWEDAASKRDQLRGAGDLAFVAPTPVRGRLYYRVFAGALQDREEARALMVRLVERGAKERVRDWDMRPTTWALALGDYTVRDEADAERDRLHEAGLAAYVLPVGDSTEALYRLYSGAYESEPASAPADSILSAAGYEATLVVRRGEPR